MAATESGGGQVLQAWLPIRVATQLREEAARKGVSISSTIRDLIEDELRTSPAGGGAARGGSSLSSEARRGADAPQEES